MGEEIEGQDKGGLIGRTRAAAAVPDGGRRLAELRSMIETARHRLAQTVNAELANLYWSIGKRIRQEIIGEGRADYGQRIVSTLSRQLTTEYGRGFSRRNVFHMVRFAEVFADQGIVQTLSAQLSWSHFLEIIYLKEPLQREFYTQMCQTGPAAPAARCLCHQTSSQTPEPF